MLNEVSLVCLASILVSVNTLIVNKHDFNYTLNPGDSLCGRQDDYDVFLLVYVHSSPVHFKNRQAIRDTWLKRSMFPHVRLVFMMGVPMENNVQEKIHLESHLFGDIVQEDFIDSYRNLTYKGIMAMKWITQYCPHTKYILKVDDDIIANTFLIMTHLDHLRQHNIVKLRTIMCLVWVRMKVIRNPKSKWYLSKGEFEPDFYDPYCSGSAYMLTPDLPPIMYNQSFYVKFFWVDDYYITGLLAHASNASHEFYNSLYAISPARLTTGFNGRRGDYTLFGHLSKAAPLKMYSYWKFILDKKLANANLRKNDTTLLDRFKYIKDFHWSRDIWDEFYSFTDDYFF